MAASINSPMAGSVWKILVKPGEPVSAGQDVVILESMKMEIPVSAEQAGVVRAVRTQEGSFVNEGDPLVELE